MLREQIEARASRAPRFIWPAPPYFEYVDPGQARRRVHTRVPRQGQGVGEADRLPARRRAAQVPQPRGGGDRQHRFLVASPDAALAAGRAAAPTGADRRYGRALPALGAPAVRPRAGEWQDLPRRDGRLGARAVRPVPVSGRAGRRHGHALVRPGRCHPLDEHRQAAREMLVDGQLASAEVVDAALSKQQAMRSRRFGDYLTEHQIVSPGSSRPR